MDRDYSYEHYRAMIVKKAKSWQITIGLPDSDFEECLSIANMAYAEALHFHNPEISSFQTYLWNGIDVKFKVHWYNHLRKWSNASMTRDGVLEMTCPRNKEVLPFHHKLMDLSSDARKIVDYIFEHPKEFCWKGYQIRRANHDLKKKIVSFGYSWRKATKIISEIQTMLKEVVPV